MSDVKTMVFPEMGSGSNAYEAALLANGGGFGGGMNNPFWAIVLLAFLRNWGGLNGDGNGSCQLSHIQDQLNTIQGQNSLMAAITGGTNEIRSLATTLNADVNAVQMAIQNVQNAICNVGGKIDMNAMQVVNAINSGDTALANQIATCCCQTQQNIQKFGYESQIANLQQSQLIQNGFSQIGYANAENTCSIKQNATDNTSRVLTKLDAIEDSRKDREIASLTAALTAANSRAERATELKPIYDALADIKCKQPSTAVVQYPNLVGIPAWQAAQLYGAYGAYGAYGLGANQGGIFG